MNKITEDLQNEVQWELENNILPFWMNRMIDSEYGGFHGQITGNNQRVVHAPKGAILNARILWTFSAAYRLLRKPEYLETATRAKRYLIDKFYDQEFEGIYWELDYTGQPVQTKKQIYALGFAIYGLSEYNRATGDKEALDYAIRLFKAIEQYSFDPEKNGYMEAFTKDWKLIEDMRLSDKDEICRKNCENTVHIETICDLVLKTFKKDDRIGITAGASTPPAIIKEVVVTMSEIEKVQCSVRNQ